MLINFIYLCFSTNRNKLSRKTCREHFCEFPLASFLFFRLLFSNADFVHAETAFDRIVSVVGVKWHICFFALLLHVHILLTLDSWAPLTARHTTVPSNKCDFVWIWDAVYPIIFRFTFFVSSGFEKRRENLDNGTWFLVSYRSRSDFNIPIAIVRFEGNPFGNFFETGSKWFRFASSCIKGEVRESELFEFGAFIDQYLVPRTSKTQLEPWSHPTPPIIIIIRVPTHCQLDTIRVIRTKRKLFIKFSRFHRGYCVCVRACVHRRHEIHSRNTKPHVVKTQ